MTVCAVRIQQDAFERADALVLDGGIMGAQHASGSAHHQALDGFQLAPAAERAHVLDFRGFDDVGQGQVRDGQAAQVGFLLLVLPGGRATRGGGDQVQRAVQLLDGDGGRGDAVFLENVHLADPARHERLGVDGSGERDGGKGVVVENIDESILDP